MFKQCSKKCDEIKNIIYNSYPYISYFHSWINVEAMAFCLGLPATTRDNSEFLFGVLEILGMPIHPLHPIAL